jgi:type II/III secretion system protein
MTVGICKHPRLVVALVLWGLVCLVAPKGIADAQTRRHIKVVLESRQSGISNREGVQGSGSIVVRRGTVRPSGRIAAGDSQTTVERSSGIFTLVLDGSESILTVATRVPQSEATYYYNYAVGFGYIERRIVFDDVGTSLRVGAAIDSGGQIRLRLTPRISYFSIDRPGAIDFTEAATDLIVPNGEAVVVGGSTSKLHEITRQILGYSSRSSSDETNLTVTATVQ